MGNLSWIIQMELECHAKCSERREAQGDYGTEDDVNTKAEIMQLQIKEGWQPPEAGRDKDRFSPRASTGSFDPVKTLISAQ